MSRQEGTQGGLLLPAFFLRLDVLAGVPRVTSYRRYQGSLAATHGDTTMTNGGEGRLGPGRANLKKSREARHAELKGLMRLPGGRVVVEYYFVKYTGRERG